MNYNATVNKRPPITGRKLTRRPQETPGLESSRFTQPSYPTQYSNVQTTDIQQQQYAYQQNTFQPMNSNPQYIPGHQQYDYSGSAGGIPSSAASSSYGTQPGFTMPAQPQFLSNPVISNMAMQYGQVFMGSSKKIVDQEIEKYVPVSRLKYYFAVDTSYVSRKLSVLLFPYLRTDWSIKYNQNEPIQPRYEVNAPDLYIPSMSFLTYILIAGLILGTSDKFSPEKLSIQASSALAWSILEIIIQVITLYVTNISTNIKTLDLVAYSSYKYVGIIIAMLAKLFFGHLGYLIALVYICISLVFFLTRTLQLVLAEPVQTQPDMYGMPQAASYSQTGIKRRRYFLLFVALSQPFLMWWLSSNIL